MKTLIIAQNVVLLDMIRSSIARIADAGWLSHRKGAIRNDILHLLERISERITQKAKRQMDMR